MPAFKKLTDAEVRAIVDRRNNPELAKYIGSLQGMTPGSWGAIELDNDEKRRVVKRRTSLAASSLGRKIQWRINRSDAKTLVFRMIDKK